MALGFGESINAAIPSPLGNVAESSTVIRPLLYLDVLESADKMKELAISARARVDPMTAESSSSLLIGDGGWGKMARPEMELRIPGRLRGPRSFFRGDRGITRGEGLPVYEVKSISINRDSQLLLRTFAVACFFGAVLGRLEG